MSADLAEAEADVAAVVEAIAMARVALFLIWSAGGLSSDVGLRVRRIDDQIVAVLVTAGLYTRVCAAMEDIPPHKLR